MLTIDVDYFQLVRISFQNSLLEEKKNQYCQHWSHMVYLKASQFPQDFKFYEVLPVSNLFLFLKVLLDLRLWNEV